MTGTIWSVYGSESEANRALGPSLNCRRQIAVWAGFLDADQNGSLDYDTPEGWAERVEKINDRYHIDATYPDMIGPDLEHGGWSEIKREGPDHEGWDHMATELARNVVDFRAAYPNAAHIKVYDLPRSNKFSRSEVAVAENMENQRRLIAECVPSVTCLSTVLYLSQSKPNWFLPYYRKAMEDAIQLGVEFGIPAVAQIVYRYGPNGGEPEAFKLIGEDEFRKFLLEVCEGVENIGVWDQAKWEWGVCQRTNPDGSFQVTTPRQNHIRAVLTDEFVAAGVDASDPVAVQLHWDTTAINAYKTINEVMGWELPGTEPQPIPTPISSVIAKSAKGVTEAIELANAYGRDAHAASEKHELLLKMLANTWIDGPAYLETCGECGADLAKEEHEPDCPSLAPPP